MCLHRRPHVAPSEQVLRFGFVGLLCGLSDIQIVLGLRATRRQTSSRGMWCANEHAQKRDGRGRYRCFTEAF